MSTPGHSPYNSCTDLTALDDDANKGDNPCLSTSSSYDNFLDPAHSSHMTSDDVKSLEEISYTDHNGSQHSEESVVEIQLQKGIMQIHLGKLT